MKKSIKKSEFRPKKEGTYRWWLCSFDVKVNIRHIARDFSGCPWIAQTDENDVFARIQEIVN